MFLIPSTAKEKLEKFHKKTILLSNKYNTYILAQISVTMGDHNKKIGGIEIYQNMMTRQKGEKLDFFVKNIPLYKRQEWLKNFKELLEI